MPRDTAPIQTLSFARERHHGRRCVARRLRAKLSAAVWGIYEPLPDCSTSQGLRDYHQDSLAWLDREIVDAIAPMIYWSIEPDACTDWATLARGFIAERGTRQVWAGMHVLDDGAFDFAQIDAGRLRAVGIAFFRHLSCSEADTSMRSRKKTAYPGRGATQV